MLRMLLPVLISAALGWLVLRLFFRPATAGLAAMFYLALGFPLGAGIYTAGAFFTFLILPPGRGDIWAAFCFPAVVAIGIGWMQIRGRLWQPLPLRLEPFSGPAITIAGIVALAACSAAALMLVNNFLAEPHGMWDAHAIWNARARTLFRAPAEWRTVFQPLQYHADYPLSLPILVYTGWHAAGGEMPVVPFAIAAAFAASAIAIAAVGVSLWKGFAWGLIAAALLACEPGFVSLGAWQYADVPLSALFAAAIVLFTLAYRIESDRVYTPALALAGAAAGLCAWMKNEGAPIVLGFTAGLLLGGASLRQMRAGLRQIGLFWIGALPVLAALGCYRAIAPSSELVGSALRRDVLPKLADAHRWLTILKSYALAWWKAPDTAVPLAAMLVFIWLISGIRIEPRLRLPLIACTCALASVAGGHLAAYLVSPYDLVWHLNTSVDRLALQLTPSFVFLSLLLVPPEFLGKRAGDASQ